MEQKTNLGDIIYYENVVKFEIAQKKKCMEKIPKNALYHSGRHNCKAAVHKCGYKSIQCEYYCNEPYGHKGLHSGTHGNIIN